MSSEYEVGKGKPPVEHQWKAGGPSPNPNGRHRKSPPKHGLVAQQRAANDNRKKDEIVDLAEEVMTTVKINGQERPATLTELAMLTAANAAAGGDVDAAEKYYRIREMHERTMASRARRRALEVELEPLRRVMTYTEDALAALGVLTFNHIGRTVIAEEALPYLLKNCEFEITSEMLEIVELGVANRQQLHELCPIRRARTWPDAMAEQLAGANYADYSKYREGVELRLLRLERLEAKDREEQRRAAKRSK